MLHGGKMGVHFNMNKEIRNIDLIIIGGGPAGLTSAMYASRAKLDILVLENAFIGGQVRSSYLIENYPGIKSIEGSKLADLLQEQALEMGAKIDEFDFLQKAALTDEEKNIETESYIYKPKAVIISTGATPRKLPLKNEKRFSGKGIHYCAVCDGAMYEDKTVAVIGGGNSALEEALFLTRFAKKVMMIRRYDYFKGQKSTLEEVLNHPKIEVLYNWDLMNVDGVNYVEKGIIRNTISGKTREISIDAVFGYIGTDPKTDLFKEVLNLSKGGYILTDENMRTNIKGVYAAGDVREKKYRQITTAVSDGAIAALDAEKYIEERGRESYV